MTDPKGGIIVLTVTLNEKGIIVNPTGSKEAALWLKNNTYNQREISK
jgi:hypothetical protein